MKRLSGDLRDERLTALNLIRFPPPMTGSLTQKRVVLLHRENEKHNLDAYYAVRMHAAGEYRTLGVTTSLGGACRFADMAVRRFAKYAVRRKGADKLNYSIEQVEWDEKNVPAARALLDTLEEAYKGGFVKRTMDERIEELGKRIDALEAKVLRLCDHRPG